MNHDSDGPLNGNGPGSTNGGGKWLSVKATAAELEVTTRTVYRFINNGKLTAYRIGRMYRITRTDLESFLQASALRPGDLDHLVDDRLPRDWPDDGPMTAR